MGHLEEPPTFTVLTLTPPQATMKIARIRGYVLIARVLFARIFIAGRGFNGTILSVIGGLVVAATVAAASPGKRSSNR
jgi:hypothetical protein